MKTKYSLEARFEVWNDDNGEKITVGEDADGLDMVDIRAVSAKGEIVSRVTMPVDEAQQVVEALVQYLKWRELNKGFE